ncbi:Hypothetical protein CINCED_3A000889 [Cinara cedri]|uniref:Uncharacterized protein n=1 Tax=Cinara cedri TaxID=506608 RepID=A0A5E4N140_9HEMI|nr:Hypothetical protein CINCED_3A000889 [Cinara cedri]
MSVDEQHTAVSDVGERDAIPTVESNVAARDAIVAGAEPSPNRCQPPFEATALTDDVLSVAVDDDNDEGSSEGFGEGCSYGFVRLGGGSEVGEGGDVAEEEFVLDVDQLFNDDSASDDKSFTLVYHSSDRKKTANVTAARKDGRRRRQRAGQSNTRNKMRSRSRSDHRNGGSGGDDENTVARHRKRRVRFVGVTNVKPDSRQRTNYRGASPAADRKRDRERQPARSDRPGRNNASSSGGAGRKNRK